MTLSSITIVLSKLYSCKFNLFNTKHKSTQIAVSINIFADIHAFSSHVNYISKLIGYKIAFDWLKQRTAYCFSIINFMWFKPLSLNPTIIHVLWLNSGIFPTIRVLIKHRKSVRIFILIFLLHWSPQTHFKNRALHQTKGFRGALMS